jgi:hypothetical protein
MGWSSEHMSWAQQMMILSYLLPPIFLVSIGLALLAPRFHSKRDQATPHHPAHALEPARAGASARKS